MQLTSYFSGYSDIVELRERRKQQLGERFKLKEFHDQFLGYGNAPVRVIGQLMHPGSSSATYASAPDGTEFFTLSSSIEPSMDACPRSASAAAMALGVRACPSPMPKAWFRPSVLA